MGKINVPLPQVETPTQPTQPSQKAEGFSIDKAKIMLQSTDSTPLFSDSPSDEALKAISLKRSLGLDPMSTEYASEMKGILEWGKEHNLSEPELLAKVKEVKYKLGAMGESAPKMIYHWLKFDVMIKDLVKKQASLEYGR